MTRAILQVELVTPCFLSGADQTSAELRAAAIRGQLRWWFRAVAGGVFGGDLAKTKASETMVFGATDRRSPLRISVSGAPGFWAVDERWPLDNGPFKVDARELARVCNVSPDAATLQRLAIRINDHEIPTDPLQHLGFGCIEYRKPEHGPKGLYLSRPCFAPGERATIELRWPPAGLTSGASQSWEIFGRALWAWVHLGGLGSRSRNGFGSLGCSAIEGSLPGGDLALSWKPEISTFRGGVTRLLREARDSAAGNWTHLSKDSRVLIGKRTFNTWAGALGALGAWALFYRRRYGSSTDPGRGDSFDYRSRDYVWAKQAGSAGGAGPAGFPDKAGLGLPLLFDGQGSSVTWTSPTTDGEDHRRASPLLFHVAKLGDIYLPVVTYLPAQLIPDDAELRFRQKTNDHWHLRPQPRAKATAEHEKVATRFLDFLLAHVAQEVRP